MKKSHRLSKKCKVFSLNQHNGYGRMDAIRHRNRILFSQRRTSPERSDHAGCKNDTKRAQIPPKFASGNAGSGAASERLRKRDHRAGAKAAAGGGGAAEENGVAVCVLPGNHDLSPVTQQEFAEIYEPFGFGEATSRDAASPLLGGFRIPIER